MPNLRLDDRTWRHRRCVLISGLREHPIQAAMAPLIARCAQRSSAAPEQLHDLFQGTTITEGFTVGSGGHEEKLFTPALGKRWARHVVGYMTPPRLAPPKQWI